MIKEHINKNAKIYVGGKWFGKIGNSTAKKVMKHKIKSSATNQKKAHKALKESLKKQQKKEGSQEFHNLEKLGVSTTASNSYLRSKLGELNRRQTESKWYRKSYSASELNKKKQNIVRSALDPSYGKFFKQKQNIWKTVSTSNVTINGKRINGVTDKEQKKAFESNLAEKTKTYLDYIAATKSEPST